MFNNEQDYSFKEFFSPLTTGKAILIIAVIGIFVYFNSLFNGFILDDNKYIISNPSMYSINPSESFLSYTNMFNMGGQYRPLPALYFSLLYSMFTTTPFYYHVFSLLIHITNTVLLFFLFKRFFNKTLSLFLSLIFLVHPLQVESVSWIAAADNSLFFLFGVSALLLSLRSHISWKRLIAISSLSLFSLLTKETGIIFIFLVVLYRVMFHKRQRFIFFVSSVFTLASYAYIRFVLAGMYIVYDSFPQIARVKLGVRLLNIPAILFYYIKNFLYPSDLGVYQVWVIKTMDFPHFYFPLFIDTFFFLFLFFLGWFIVRTDIKKFPVYLFFLAWLVVGLIFHSQLFPLDMTVADRWMYLPIVGLLGVVGVSIQAVKPTSENKLVFGLIMGIILISLLSLRTIIRNTNWNDEVMLFSHDLHIDDITAQEGLFGQVKSQPKILYKYKAQTPTRRN